MFEYIKTIPFNVLFVIGYFYLSLVMFGCIRLYNIFITNKYKDPTKYNLIKLKQYSYSHNDMWLLSLFWGFFLLAKIIKALIGEPKSLIQDKLRREQILLSEIDTMERSISELRIDSNNLRHSDSENVYAEMGNFHRKVEAIKAEIALTKVKGNIPLTDEEEDIYNR